MGCNDAGTGEQFVSGQPLKPGSYIFNLVRFSNPGPGLGRLDEKFLGGGQVSKIGFRDVRQIEYRGLHLDSGGVTEHFTERIEAVVGKCFGPGEQTVFGRPALRLVRTDLQSCRAGGENQSEDESEQQECAKDEEGFGVSTPVWALWIGFR